MVQVVPAPQDELDVAKSMRLLGATVEEVGRNGQRTISVLKFNHIRIPDVGAVGEEMRALTKLQELHLRSCKLHARGITALGPHLIVLPYLRVLDLDCNNIGDRGAAAIACYIPRLTGLQALHLSDNKISDVGASNLASSFSCLRRLEILTLSANRIADTGVQRIAASLEPAQALEQLELCDNRITDTGAETLIKHLARLPGFRVLNLSWNSLAGRGAALLAQHIRGLSCLQVLNLGWNQIGDAAAEDLAPVLATLDSLETLNLGWNTIGDRGAQALAEHLTRLQRLKTLNLTKNEILESTSRSISQDLRSLPSLTSVKLSRQDTWTKASTAGLSAPIPARGQRSSPLSHPPLPATSSAPLPATARKPERSRRDRSPIPEHADRSPSPALAGRGPSPPRAERGPSPPRADRGPSPPRADRGPSPPRADRGPSPPRADRGPSPPRTDRGPSPPRADRGPSPPRADRGLSPPPRADHDYSPPHADRGLSPPPRADRDYSPPHADRGLSRGHADRSPSPPLPPDRSPSPMRRKRSPSPPDARGPRPPLGAIPPPFRPDALHATDMMALQDRKLGDHDTDLGYGDGDYVPAGPPGVGYSSPGDSGHLGLSGHLGPPGDSGHLGLSGHLGPPDDAHRPPLGPELLGGEGMTDSIPLQPWEEPHGGRSVGVRPAAGGVSRLTVHVITPLRPVSSGEAGAAQLETLGWDRGTIGSMSAFRGGSIASSPSVGGRGRRAPLLHPLLITTYELVGEVAEAAASAVQRQDPLPMGSTASATSHVGSLFDGEEEASMTILQPSVPMDQTDRLPASGLDNSLGGGWQVSQSQRSIDNMEALTAMLPTLMTGPNTIGDDSPKPLDAAGPPLASPPSAMSNPHFGRIRHPTAGSSASARGRSPDRTSSSAHDHALRGASPDGSTSSRGRRSMNQFTAAARRSANFQEFVKRLHVVEADDITENGENAPVQELLENQDPSRKLLLLCRGVRGRKQRTLVMEASNPWATSPLNSTTVPEGGEAQFIPEAHELEVMDVGALLEAFDASLASEPWLTHPLPEEGLMQLTCLDVGGRRIGDASMPALAVALRFMPNVRVLQLAHNSIGDEGLEHLAMYIHVLIHIEELHLQHNHFSAPGLGALAGELQSLETLTVINLSGNPVGEAGAAALADALPALVRLSRLSVADCNLRSDGLAVIAHRALGLHELAHLDVSDNGVEADGAAALADCRLELDTLLISGNPIGASGLAAIMTGLPRTVLDASRCQLGDSGALALADSLRAAASTLRRLLLSENCIMDRGVEALAKCLPVQEMLVELELGGNQVGDPGAAALATYMEVAAGLQLLGLESNCVGDRGMRALAAAKLSPRVQCIRLGGNCPSWFGELIVRGRGPPFELAGQ